MYTGFLHLHSTLRWVIFLLLIILIVKAFSGRKGGVFSEGDRKMSLFLLISSHITLLVGLFQWFTGPYGIASFQNKAMGEIMSSRIDRFFSVEHPIGMIAAIVLITVGYSRSKRAEGSAAKWNALYWPLFFALIVLLVTIPWPFREVGAGRSWLPGM